MQLKVPRQTFTQDSSIGRLDVDGQFECCTLEDVVRPEKVYGETAIPATPTPTRWAASPSGRRSRSTASVPAVPPSRP